MSEIYLIEDDFEREQIEFWATQVKKGTKDSVWFDEKITKINHP